MEFLVGKHPMAPAGVFMYFDWMKETKLLQAGDRSVKTNVLILIGCMSALVGCSQNDQPAATIETNQGLASTPAGDMVTNLSSAVTNSPIVMTNEISQTVGSLPLGDQAATEADAGIIQRIRKSILADNALAAVEPNIHIACTNGEVTLTGTVPSDLVKMGLSDKAKAVADVKIVNNALAVQ